MTAIAADPAAPVRKADVNRAAALIVIGVIATTLAQPDVLGRLPITNMLKNEMHVSRSVNAAFFFLSGVAWYFKPLAGVLTDAFPIFGTRRKAYMAISAAIGAVLLLGLIVTPHRYQPLLWMCIAINTFTMGASTVVGGYMVERAQAEAGSGRLASLRMLTQTACSLVAAPAAGWLASIAFGWTAGICAMLLFALAPAALILLREPPARVNSAEVLADARQRLAAVIGARPLWAAAGIVLLVYIAPGFSTALFYKQQNELHMTTQAQGTLGFIGAAVGLLAPLVYAWACRRWSLRVLLPSIMAVSAVGTLIYLFYTTVLRAQIITGLGGFVAVAAEVALIDLIVRATPPGGEAMGFAILISVRNFALFGTDWLGSLMLDKFHVSFAGLVLANAATTALAVPAALLLPAALLSRRDAQPPPVFPEPKTQMEG